MGFYVFQCNKCGKWAGKDCRDNLQKATFNCFFCGNSKKIYDKQKFGLHLKHKGPFDNAQQVKILVQNLNNK